MGTGTSECEVLPKSVGNIKAAVPFLRALRRGAWLGAEPLPGGIEMVCGCAERLSLIGVEDFSVMIVQTYSTGCRPGVQVLEHPTCRQKWFEEIQDLL